ncbi:MAG: hypothetical protein ACLTM8_10855 [Veillonella parvula]
MQILRTFLLVNISWYFDMAVSLSAAFAMMKSTVTGFSLATLTDGSLMMLGLDKLDYMILAMGCLSGIPDQFFKGEGNSDPGKSGKTFGDSLGRVWNAGVRKFPCSNVMTTGGFIYAQFRFRGIFARAGA